MSTRVSTRVSTRAQCRWSTTRRASTATRNTRGGSWRWWRCAPLTHSLTHSLISHSLISLALLDADVLSLSLSLAHSLAYTLFTHSLTHSLTSLHFTLPIAYSCTHCPAPPIHTHGTLSHHYLPRSVDDYSSANTSLTHCVRVRVSRTGAWTRQSSPHLSACSATASTSPPTPSSAYCTSCDDASALQRVSPLTHSLTHSLTHTSTRHFHSTITLNNRSSSLGHWCLYVLYLTVLLTHLPTHSHTRLLVRVRVCVCVCRPSPSSSECGCASSL